MNARRLRTAQRGATLIEVLVALVITVIGLLGLVSLQMRAYGAESESYQRAHAAILLGDMLGRIRANPGDAAAYAGVVAGDAPQDCSGVAAGAPRDLCEWGNLLRGAAESIDGAQVGAMRRAVGCITTPEPAVVIVAIAWEGTVPGGAPANACGADVVTDVALRRVVAGVIRVADLGA